MSTNTIDEVILINRCCKCRKLIHLLDEYCQYHWDELMRNYWKIDEDEDLDIDYE